MALLKIIKLSTKTWKHNSDVDGDFILTKFYAKQEDNEFLLVETYGAKRRKYLISEIEVYDIGGTAETFSNFTDLFLRLEALKYPAFYVDGEFTFNPSSYDLSEFANAETDKFVKESEVLSNDISTYTSATTPLSGTEKALIHDGTDFKEVAVSEFGGGSWGSITGTLSDQTDLQDALDEKQDVLTNPVTGVGTTNYIPKLIGASTLDDSIIYDDGTLIGIDTNSPEQKLHVKGNIRFGQEDGSPEVIYTSGGQMAKYDPMTSVFSFGANTINVDSPSGYVGIGTTAPSTELEVDGVITATGGDSTEWNAKQETLVSGTNIKTVNGVSILGSGDLITLEDKDVFGTTQNEWIGYPTGWVSTNQPTTTGTADNISPSFAGNEFLKTWRRRYVSASTAGSSVEFRDSAFRNIAIGSGFTAVFKFGFEDASAVANARSFVGFYGSNATFGNVNPSAQTNLVGVSNDTGEANLQLIHRGSGGTAVKVDLGANFPSNTIATDEYMLILVNEFGSTEVIYYVYRLNTSDVATGTITTDLPASTVGLSPYFWRNNGTTALAVRLSLMKYGLYKRF